MITTQPQLFLCRIRLRDENGPTDELSEPQWMLYAGGQYYPLSRLTSAPGLTPNQLAPVEETGEALRALVTKATAKVNGLELSDNAHNAKLGVQLPAGTKVVPGDLLVAADSVPPSPTEPPELGWGPPPGY